LPFNARLTLETGVAVPNSDQNNKTEIFLTPFEGDRIALYNGSTWDTFELNADISIKVTDVQNGDTHNGTMVIDNLTDTSQLIVGMEVTGTGVGVGALIDSVDSATQITTDVNSTADGTVAITSKVAAGVVFDLFTIDDSGLALRMVAWTDATNRATAITQVDGIDVLTGETGWRLAGTGRIRTITAGIIDDSRFEIGGARYPRRMLSNRYNRKPRPFAVIDSTDSWVYAVANNRAWGGDNDNKVEFVNCIDDDPLWIAFNAAASGGGNLFIMFDLDGTTIKDNDVTGWISIHGVTSTYYNEQAGIGGHKITLVERADVAGITIYGDAGAPTFLQMGATGWIMG